MLLRFAVPVVTLVIGVLTGPWFAFLFGCRIRRDDAELARRSLYAAKSVLQMSLDQKGGLDHPWTVDGVPLEVSSLLNSFRTIHARCHDQKLCSPIAELMKILPSVAESVPHRAPMLFFVDEPMPSDWVENERVNAQSANVQLDASGSGLEYVVVALERLDHLERRLTFWEGRLS